MKTQPAYAEALTSYLSMLTVIGIALVVFFAVYLTVVWYTKKKPAKVILLVSEYVLPLGFILSFAGMSLSLFYSEVLHFAPCELCWYQRIFLYSQVFLFGYAWYRKDRGILPYALLLSVIGGVIGIYHHMLQIGFDLMKPCSSAPFAVDCAKPSFIEFGFVTFPFMSVVLFAFLVTVITVGVRFRK